MDFTHLALFCDSPTRTADGKGCSIITRSNPEWSEALLRRLTSPASGSCSRSLISVAIAVTSTLRKRNRNRAPRLTVIFTWTAIVTAVLLSVETFLLIRTPCGSH